MEVAGPLRQGALDGSPRRFGRRDSPRVSVVIPTLNEERNLPGVLARLPAGVHQLIVVDGRSSDQSVAVVRRLWPRALVLTQSGTGKGDALALGFAAATGDIVVTLDADGSTDPAELPRYVAALTAGADLAKGSRFLEGAGSADLTRTRRVGARALTGVVNLLFSTGYTDLCYGYTAFWRDRLDQISVAAGFEVEASMSISAARAGLVVAEVPSFERARVHGATKLRTVRDGTRVLGEILAARFRRRPVTTAPAGQTVATQTMDADVAEPAEARA
jgi:glycosyltransferase involved in cell wall biosynthesis